MNALPQSIRLAVLALVMVLMAVFLATCGGPLQTPVPSLTPLPTDTITPQPSVTPSLTITLPFRGTRQVWEDFAPPILTPVTPVPPPLTGLVIPEEVRVLVVAGVDRNAPYTGRTDAIALVIYHPRFARASLVSVPPDLFGYIPGYTMQRMYTAYATGGPERLMSALHYNLGVRPNSYAILNLDDFTQLIDDLGGINVSVIENVSRDCPGIIPGVILLNGDQTLCYMRLRYGEEEFARNRRQQEVLRTIFLRMVEGGNLARLPGLYDAYRGAIDTNLTRDEMLSAVPLALKLGDPSRIGYFTMSDRELNPWTISEKPEAVVFVPEQDDLQVFIQQAIDYVSVPSPLREVVITLEYELTISPTPTNTYTVTATPTATNSPMPTFTLTRTITPTRTVTNTPPPTSTPLPTSTYTPTRTLTPTPTLTATPTFTATSTP